MTANSSEKKEIISFRGGNFKIIPIIFGITASLYFYLRLNGKDLFSTIEPYYYTPSEWLTVFFLVILLVDIYINLYGYYIFKLTLFDDGTIDMKGMESLGWAGTTIESTINSKEATSAQIVTTEEVGNVAFCLYKGDDLISQWSTKPVSIDNMHRFLVALKKINPKIEFDAGCQGIFSSFGKTKQNLSFIESVGLNIWIIVSAFLGFGYFIFFLIKKYRLLMFIGLIPLWEIIFLKSIFKEFTWFQQPLISGLILSFYLPMTLLLFILIFAQFLKRIVFVILFVLFLTWNTLFFMDFFKYPIVLNNQRVTISKIGVERDSTDKYINFRLDSDPSKLQSIRFSQYHLAQITQGFNEPITIYLSFYTKTILKIEKSATGEILYLDDGISTY